MDDETHNAVGIGEVKVEVKDLDRRIGILEKDVKALRDFQRWVMGIFAALTYVAGLLSDKVKHLIGGG